MKDATEAEAKLKKTQLAQRKKEAERLGINVEGAHNTHMSWPTNYATHHGSTESCRCVLVDLPIPEETGPAGNIAGQAAPARKAAEAAAAAAVKAPAA